MIKYVLIISLILSNILFCYNQTFKVGEYIKYDVLAQVPEFNISGKVGALEAKVLAISNIDGKPAYHLYAHVYTTGAANLLFKVSDIFEAWVTTNDFKTLIIKKDATEGSWTNKETSIVYDNYYLYTDKRNTDRKIEFTNPAYDALSLVFFMRFVDKNIGTFKIDWLEGPDTKKDIRFTIENGEKIKTKITKEKLETTRVYEKEKYGTDALIAKDGKYNQVPLDVIIAEQKLYGLTLRVRGVIRVYKDGTE